MAGVQDAELRALKSAGASGTTDKAESRIAPAFEDVLSVIGSRGIFQMRLNILFLFFGICCNSISIYIYYLAMQTPDHWCHVPGRENTSMSLEEWKNFTIPKEGDSFSKCRMYNASGAVVPCQHAWDYDHTWFSLTAPSQMDWVCDRQYFVSDAMFYAQNISVALGLLFGYIGDIWGRRKQFVICVSVHVLSRLLLVFTPSVYVLFILAESLVAAVAGPAFEATLSVGLELTDIRRRAAINGVAGISFDVGVIFTGLVAWSLPNWTYFVLISAFCSLVLLLLTRWFPESPRWLACRGRDQEALSLLQHIATVNGTRVPPVTLEVLHNMAKSKTDRKGFLSIFSSWNLFKNTVLLIIARTGYLLTSYSLVLGVGSLSSNPFLSMCAQGVARLPGSYVAYYCANRFGRRWPATAAPLLAALGAAVFVLLLNGEAAGTYLTVTMTVMQFFTTASLWMCNLQSAEVHPTCLRQITACLEWAVAGILMSTVPYIVFLGGSVDKRLPFVILGAINIVAGFAISFLPESALQRLPETLADAAVFGKGRSYWSWRPKPPPAYMPE